MKKFIGLVGTNATTSTNRQLLQFMQAHFKKDATIELMEIQNLPMFNKPATDQLPEIIKEMAAKIEAADGVIISTAEYDHSAPAALINALDWLSYNIYPFVDKPVMVTGASYGALGSSRAQAQLRQLLDAPELHAMIMPSSEFLLGNSLNAFTEDGQLKDATTIEKLEGIFADFLLFVDIAKQLKNAHAANKKAAADFDWDKIR
ncbi:MAG TPA: NAD(P)H-dependent oxidoreductase [Lapidilactobacillus dextrinicus]|uniref:NAD(P)H-dependent oxidoreductase n=1 Tax=Lapidilactobacillus dextrinicus TaxID=51664 RepID=A0A921B3Z3_9LACO|nr:NAD(P)H-dependent oxidoreductase [Lapidilactobacillus dextrinicus]